MAYTIYKHTSPSGKSYIGLTKYTMEKRFKQHITDSKRMDYKFSRAIKKYNGVFESVILSEGIKSLHDAQVQEMYYISLHDTYKNGYNMTKGGDGNWSKDSHAKGIITKNNNIIDGLNQHQRAALKSALCMSKTQDNDKTIREKATLKMLKTKNLVGVDGLSIYQRAGQQGGITLKENGTTKGKNSSTATRINIYNNNDELMYECHGNFLQICEDNSLPKTLAITYREHSKLYDNSTVQTISRAKNFNTYQYKGWYARKVQKWHLI